MAATTAPAFLRTGYLQLGNGHVAADFNGDGKRDLAGQGAQSAAVLLNKGDGASPSFAVLLNSTGAAPPPTPAAPTLLGPAQHAKPAQPVSFDWTDVTAATSYRIPVDDMSTFSTPIVIDRTVSASEFTSSALAAKRHWWRVWGINAAGTAGASSTVRRFTPRTATSGPTLSAVASSPTTAVGGNESRGTATLTAAARSGGAVVSLSFPSSAATVPANVTVAATPTDLTVPAGATSAGFTITTSEVTSSTAEKITARAGGVTRSTILTVAPPASTASAPSADG